MFANKFLNLALSSLVCSSMLYPNLIYVVPYIHVRYYFFILFITLKPVLFSLKCAVLQVTMGELSIARVSQSVYSVPYLFLSYACIPLHPMSPLLKASAILPGLYFSTLYHCVRVVKYHAKIKVKTN